MVTDSFFALACAGLIAFLFGLALCFSGYRLFIILLPVWGFFFGLWLGAESLQALFGVGFLATVTSWVVGFIVGAIFAVLSYLFYVFAVALAAGSLGYYLGVGLMEAIGIKHGLPCLDRWHSFSSGPDLRHLPLQPAKMADHHRHILAWGRRDFWGFLCDVQPLDAISEKSDPFIPPGLADTDGSCTLAGSIWDLFSIPEQSQL